MAAPLQVGLSPEGLERIDATVQKFIDDKKLAGAVTIVARRGQVAQFEAYGLMDIEAKKPMRKDTIFRIYSMTKPVASVAAMMLHEEGKLELDAPVWKYLPEAKGLNTAGDADAANREMTVRDLLRHTSGLPNNATVDRLFRSRGFASLGEYNLEEIVAKIGNVTLLYPPGTDWYYSFASDVVGRLVEVVSGRPLDEFLAERIFRPLQMEDTGFFVPAHKRDRLAAVYGNGLRIVDAPEPGTVGGSSRFEKRPKFLCGGGGLVSTAADYMRFCLMLSGKGTLDGKRLLKAKTVAMMTRNQLPESLLPISRRPAGRGFGLGFAVRVRRIDSEPSSIGEYEWLGGAGTEFWISPRDELVVITLTQNLPMRQLGRALKPIVYGAIAEERYLLLDSRVVESTDNAKLTLGTVKKHGSNPLLEEDRPWEPRFDNVYPNVTHDEQEGLYKCWYNGFIVDERTTSTPEDKRNPRDRPDYMGIRPNRREEGVCYAVSNDGVDWEKPELGLVEFDGNKRNNLVMRGPSGAGVFKDLREPDPARRYKIFFSGQTNSIQRVAFSPDGLHWSKPILCPEIEAGGDTHNCALWSPPLRKYVGIMRLWNGQRIIGRTESPDFVKWTKSRAVLQGDPEHQTHDMVVVRTAGIYIGLPGVMEFPGGSRRNVKQHVELAWSPDSVTWHRVEAGTPFIGHTPTTRREYGTVPYDWGCIFASTPIILDGEIRIYYGASDWYFFDWRKGCLALATLRPDGWAGYEQIERNKSGSVTTIPFFCTGRTLRLSADVSRNGSVKVTLLDPQSTVLAEGEPITETVTDVEVRWKRGASVERLEGRAIKLGLELRESKVYSFGFRE